MLVFRLATSHSVEGKMLRRACDKMALERLVIKKGVFKEVLDMGVDDGDKVRRRHTQLLLPPVCVGRELVSRGLVLC